MAKPKTGQWEDTFAIITTDPNTKMAEIHNRQPVVPEPSAYAQWLEESDRPPLGERVGVSGLQLLDQRLNVGGDVPA